MACSTRRAYPPNIAEIREVFGEAVTGSMVTYQKATRLVR